MYVFSFSFFFQFFLFSFLFFSFFSFVTSSLIFSFGWVNIFETGTCHSSPIKAATEQEDEKRKKEKETGNPIPLSDTWTNLLFYQDYLLSFTLSASLFFLFIFYVYLIGNCTQRFALNKSFPT